MVPCPLGLVSPHHHTTYRRLIVFLGLYNGIINNQNIGRFIRYNAMQAILLDVLLM